MEDFIQNWGYIAVLLGSAVEGELIVMLAGAAAKLGHLNLLTVMFIAFWGTLVADQLCFYIGRFYGPTIMNKYPILKYKSRRVFSLLRRYDTWFIMSFRFIYGIRVASPIIIGASQLSPRRFTLLNVPAAFIWAVIIPIVGYLLGDALKIVMDNFHRVQRYVVIVGLPLIVLAYFLRRYYKKRRAQLVGPKKTGIVFGEGHKGD